MFRELNADEIEVRVSRTTSAGVELLLYKTARTDAAILDETVGHEKWQCDFKAIDGKLYGGIGIKCGEEWVWKWDAGTEANMEPTKSEASDAFKRAGFKWGIGRSLYTAPRIFVYADKCRKLQQGKNGKMQCYDSFSVAKVAISDGRIKGIRIVNDSNSGAVVYSWKEG